MKHRYCAGFTAKRCASRLGHLTAELSTTQVRARCPLVRYLGETPAHGTLPQSKCNSYCSHKGPALTSRLAWGESTGDLRACSSCQPLARFQECTDRDDAVHTDTRVDRRPAYQLSSQSQNHPALDLAHSLRIDRPVGPEAVR